MRRVTLVRRPDGETVPFDESRVVDAIERALAAAGARDARLAGEIAAVVGLFLEKTFYDEVPTVEQVEDMVEKVLIETGHASAAKAFILHRERRSRLRAARAARDGFAEPTLFDPRAVVVDDTATGQSGPYSRESLARALAVDGSVPRAVADEIAAAVEEKLRRGGVARAPASLVRAIAESELLARDAPVELRRRAAAMLSPEVLETAIHRRTARTGAAEPFLTPASAARDLGAMAMRSHALTQILPADAARAHLDGDLFVHGLSLPGAVFGASFTADDVKQGTTRGSGSRGAEDAALTTRRLAAAVGRSARLLAESSSGSTALAAAPLSFASLCVGRGAEDLAEEAWHLLLETSADPGGRRLEVDMTPGVPDALADEAAIGPSGEELSVPMGELSGIATELAAAMLRTLSRAGGLPPRELLPVPVVGVSQRATESGGGRAALRLAAELALRGERVVFPMLRERGPVIGTSICRGRDPASPLRASRCCAGRVTLNLPRAARRAGRGNVEGFLRECDRLVDLAVSVHRARRDVLALAGAASGGPLAALFRAPRGRAPLYEIASTSWSVALTGLNEALVHLTGFELHEGDEAAVRAARRIASYLSVRVKASGMDGDLVTVLDADDDAEPARRFLASDRRQEPERMQEPYAGRDAYTPGVSIREDAPVDALLRLDREEPLHGYLATATLRVPFPAQGTGGADGLVAFLAKCLRAGSAHQVEFRIWS
jgi:ribonucleoside-triphosphate reductase